MEINQGQYHFQPFSTSKDSSITYKVDTVAMVEPTPLESLFDLDASSIDFMDDQQDDLEEFFGAEESAPCSSSTTTSFQVRGVNDDQVIDTTTADDDTTSNFADLEPSPLAVCGDGSGHQLHVVPYLPVASAPWIDDEAYLDCLRPLLVPTKVSNPQTVHIQDMMAVSRGDINRLRTNGISHQHKTNNLISDDSTISSGSSSSSPRSGGSGTSNNGGNRIEQWNAKYEELVTFKKHHGHSNVPLEFAENPSLSHWVKRQRYQYGLKVEGKHSTLSNERQELLNSLGFVWDSHAASWDLRYEELLQFKERYRHCNVPTKYPQNPQLAIWVKCQRRQYKLHERGRKSNITPDRVQKLLDIGFVFHPRGRNTNRSKLLKLKQQQQQQQANRW